MKNIFKTALCGCMALIMTTGHCTFAANVGDKIEKVLSTDIVTYIEGIKVPSFNIAGRTAVVVENLNAMGLPFGVSYDDLTRTLTISDSDIFGTGGRDYFHFAGNESSLPIGTPVMDVLYTDIKTYYDFAELESFNIGGFTCVYATDLAEHYGVSKWNEEERTVNIYRKKGDIIASISKESATHKLPAEESVITRDETMDRWGSPAKSYLLEGENGTYVAVQISDTINVETYDSNLSHISSVKIKKELPIFGGFYAGEEYNYIAFGQENLNDSDSKTVIKIVVYDKKFKKVKEVAINNCKTSIPFDASAGEMTENDDYLVLHTSRSQYLEENGARPQTQLTIIIDKKTWSVVNPLDKFQENHTSHALREFVKIDNGKIITANYSDTTPVRGAFLQKLDFDGKLYRTQSLFSVGGPLAANCTGAMIGGFEVSEDGYLVSMSTIDHSLATNYTNVNIEGIETENRDVYLLWADKNTWQVRRTRITDYSEEKLSASVPYLVKLKDGNFMVLWQRFSDDSNVSNTLCYAFIDSLGNQIGETLTAEGRLSESCRPIERRGKVMWYVNTGINREFYEVDADPSTAELLP